MPIIGKNVTDVRIHASGDFFSQEYFDAWLDICCDNPSVNFWAFTKSIDYWVNRLNDIPHNLNLTASFGGKQDYLIRDFALKSAIVVSELCGLESAPIDTNDYYAAIGDHSFILLDNNKTKLKKMEVVCHEQTR